MLGKRRGVITGDGRGGGSEELAASVMLITRLTSPVHLSRKLYPLVVAACVVELNWLGGGEGGAEPQRFSVFPPT